MFLTADHEDIFLGFWEPLVSSILSSSVVIWPHMHQLKQGPTLLTENQLETWVKKMLWVSKRT